MAKAWFHRLVLHEERLRHVRALRGHSTFYAHYRGKDDLLLRSFEGMLAALDEHTDRDGPTDRIAPVRELFDHVWRSRRFHQALVRARVMERQHQARVAHPSGLIERRLAARRPAGSRVAVPAPVLAQALAGAPFALLTWWADHDAPYTPERMDAMFHALLPAP